MNLKRLLIIILLLFCEVAFALEPPADPVVAKVEDAIRAGMEATILNDFDSAFVLFQEIKERYPDHPVGYFYYGATLQAKMLDAENFSRITEFEDLMKLSIEKSKALNEDENEPWMWFFEGSAHLYSSFMNTKNGSMWSAYRNARSGVKALEKVIELDSTFYDAYLGVGSFKYWKSSKAKSLTWLPFISDERDVGIRMVRQAIRNGRFVPLVGADQLAWILLDSGDHEGALKLAIDNHELYPTSRFFKWTLVSIYRKSGKPDETEALFSSLLEEIRIGTEKNYYNEIICLLRLAEIAAGRAEFDRANLLLDELFELKLDEAMRKRANHNIKDARELRKTLPAR